MAFEFKSLTEKQYLSDMTKEVNRVGDYLKSELSREEVEAIDSPDFDDILKTINITGYYYVTTSKNQPKDENWNGYVFFEKRNNRYYKIYFNPFNNENLYLRTYNNGDLSDWKKFILNEETNNWQKYNFTNDQGQYTTQENVDIREINNSKTVYVNNLVDPPKPELNEGWLNTKVHENGNTSITTFNPINSTTTYTKMQKRAREVQNPNLLRDSLFEKTKHYFPAWGEREQDPKKPNYYWDTTQNTEVTITREETLFENPSIKITNDSNVTYPLIRSSLLEIGEEIQEGDKITFSAYLYVPELKKMEDNVFYIEITEYPSAGASDVNPKVNQKDYGQQNLIEQEWNKLSVTATVPTKNSNTTYIAVTMRINNAESGTKTGMVGYYTLPKLEKGDKATPFITHVDDEKQFDEIYTNWLENPDEQSVLNNYTTDINNDNYFKYVFWKDEVGNMTLQDLLQTLPQGFHTFYAQKGIEGVPENKSIRGVVQVDNDNGDITAENKFISAQFIDYDGLNYNLYYDDSRFSEADSQDGWSPLRQTEQATYLWDGTLDLGEVGAKVTLSDSILNYEFVELTYYTISSGHLATRKVRVNPDYSDSYYIRDFNIGNSATGTGLSAFEGYFTVDKDNPTEAVSKMAKHLGVTAKNVIGFNDKNIIEVKRITGINTI